MTSDELWPIATILIVVAFIGFLSYTIPRCTELDRDVKVACIQSTRCAMLGDTDHIMISPAK